MVKPIVIAVCALIVLAVALYAMLIGSIDKANPTIVTFAEPMHVFGIEINTSDREIYKDVGRAAAMFNEAKRQNPIPNLKHPWERVFISKDYDEGTQTFKYIVGDVVTQCDTIPEGFSCYEIPAITYAVFTIKPKSRIAWGVTMGRMKRYIYTQWLPQSGYRGSDMLNDFELHNDRSLGKKPEISLFVALK